MIKFRFIRIVKFMKTVLVMAVLLSKNGIRFSILNLFVPIGFDMKD